MRSLRLRVESSLSLQRPAPAVGRIHEFLRLLAGGDAHGRAVPFEAAVREADGHDAQEHHLGQRAAVLEIRRGGLAGLAGADPVALVGAVGLGDAREGLGGLRGLLGEGLGQQMDAARAVRPVLNEPLLADEECAVGAEVVVERSNKEAVEFLRERVMEMEASAKKVAETIDRLRGQMNEINKRIESGYQQAMASGQEQE